MARELCPLIQVATVLTACGIETCKYLWYVYCTLQALQQCLPLAVLKLQEILFVKSMNVIVATVLTACGIETHPSGRQGSSANLLQQCLPLAVLKHRNSGNVVRH